MLYYKIYFILLILLPVTSFGQNSYFVSFHGTTEGKVGHAFVSFGYESEERQMTVHDGIWGLYPKNQLEGAASFIIGPVDGYIKDDWKTKKESSLYLIVSKEKYEQAIKILNQWKNKDYELTKIDCLAFIIEIASLLDDKIVLPSRARLELPNNYVIKLIKLNK